MSNANDDNPTDLTTLSAWQAFLLEAKKDPEAQKRAVEVDAKIMRLGSSHPRPWIRRIYDKSVPPPGVEDFMEHFRMSREEAEDWMKNGPHDIEPHDDDDE